MGPVIEKVPARRFACGWLTHPVTVLATVVLAVNDHLLKRAYPGLVTGKLSDLAGLVVAPALMALVITTLVPRATASRVAAPALAVVGAGFAVAKTTAVGAAAASQAWSAVAGFSVVRQDVTDLAAL